MAGFVKKLSLLAAGVCLAGAVASVGLAGVLKGICALFDYHPDALCGPDGALGFMKYYAAIGTVGVFAILSLAGLISGRVRRSQDLIALHVGFALVLGGWVYNELAGPPSGVLELSLNSPDDSERYGCVSAPSNVSDSGVSAQAKDVLDSDGFILAVDQFTIDVWPDTGMVRQYFCSVRTWPLNAADEAPAVPVVISVNHPFVNKGWWIYQEGYGPRKDRNTNQVIYNPYTGEPIYCTVLKCVKDVGLPIVMLGGLLLILGALLYQFRELDLARKEASAVAAERFSGASWSILALYGLAFIGAVAMLIHRTIATGHAPLQNMYEFLMCTAAFVPLCTFLDVWRVTEAQRVRTLLVDAALQTFVLLPVCFFMNGSVGHLPPALQSPFFIPHVGAYVLGYIFLVRAACGVGRRMVPLGFFLLTLGLVLGATWGKVCWGHWWQFDPKEMWSLATWFVYAAYFHLRPRLSPRARQAFLIAGAVMVVLTLTWINLSRIFMGMHSYASAS